MLRRPIDWGDDEAGRDRWILSYADFITLLFAFFVVLYAISSVDLAKLGRVSAGMQQAFDEGGGQPIRLDLRRPGGTGDLSADPEGRRAAGDRATDRLPPPLAAAHDAFQASLGSLLEPEALEEVAPMRGTPRGLTISLSAAHLFGPGSAEIRPEAEAVLARLGNVLRTVAAPVRLEGHTDDGPVRSAEFPSNWELSTARATRVLRFLIDRHGLRPERLSAAGYAQHRPLHPNDTAENRARNRRVDVVLIADPLAGYEPPGPEAQLGRLLDRLPPVETEPPAAAGSEAKGTP